MGFSEDRAQGRFGPAYLIVAENPYILWDAAESWKSVWRSSAGATADACRITTLYGADLDLDQLAALVTALPMFAELQLVIIRDTDKVPAKKREALVALLSCQSEATRLLLCASSVDRRLKSTKTLLQLVSVEEFPRIYENHLPGWARRIAGDCDRTLAPAAADLLAAHHGMDLFGMRQTIERAALFVGEKRRLEVRDIESVSAGTGSHNIFNLLAAIAASDLRKSLATVGDLFAGGNRTAMWLSAIFTHYSQLFEVLSLPESISNQAAAAQLGTKPYFVKTRRQEAELFSAEALEQALSATYETEYLIRTSKMPPRQAFELLVYRLCRRQRLKTHVWVDLTLPVTSE